MVLGNFERTAQVDWCNAFVGLLVFDRAMRLHIAHVLVPILPFEIAWG